MGDDPPGNVEEPVAQALRFARCQLTVEEQVLRKGHQITAEEHELQPDRVVGKGAEGQVAKPGGLGATDGILHCGPGAVDLLEARDATASLIGEEDLEAVAV